MRTKRASCRPSSVTIAIFTSCQRRHRARAGGTLCQLLIILEGYPLRELGYGSAQALHYQIEAMRHAYVDRNHLLGDPAFVKNPLERLLDRKERTSDPHSRSPEAGRGLLEDQSGRRAARRHSTRLTIPSSDSKGNAVSVTYTLNDWFGARVTAAGTGIVLNNEMDDFTAKVGAPNLYGLVQGAANRIEPGKRPLSSMTPTIVTREGKPWLIIGTMEGSRIITAVMLTMLNVMDFGMDIQEAVDAPRIHQQWQPETTTGRAVCVEPRHATCAERHGAQVHGVGARESYGPPS